jgi:phosphohistidine phosphatase SixA
VGNPFRLLPSIVAGAALLATAHPFAATPNPCPATRFFFVHDDLPLLPAGGPSLEELRFDPAGVIDLGPCGPTLAAVRAFGNRTVVRARWGSCGDLQRVRLEARLAAPACATMRGWVRARGTRRHKFEVTRASGLAVEIAGTEVRLSWLADPPVRVRLLRRLNAAPAGPEDVESALVFEGVGTSAAEPLARLLPDTQTDPRTDHYALFPCSDDGTCEAVGSRTTLTPTITQALRGGGYVLHWRHSAANVCTDQVALGPAATTTSPGWWKSCDANCETATARQLNAVGMEEARSIGQVFRERGIPVGRVLSSEFCRNVSTAELMDFGPVIEQRPEITFFVYDEANRCANAYALIAEMPAAGTNTALIGHTAYPPPGCPILEELAWSEAAVFKPDGAGGSVFVVRIRVGDWPQVP